ncbi:MAG TPA: hypothetical protein VHD85_09205 [Terracidiphilus sp.]|nr:hypothetical protein [Terracidiphilus sp.]
MKDVGKLIVCWLAYVAALIVTGITIQSLQLPMMSPPDEMTVATRFLIQLVAGALLVLGLYPLARGITGSIACRSIALGGFLLLALGLNGMLETKIFSSFLDGKLAGTIVFYVFLALFVGDLMGWVFGSAGQPAGLPHRNWKAWGGRGIVAWLAWPVIYFLFGISVTPIVMPYYRAGIVGLHIPLLTTVIATQLVRSIVFLCASLPFLALWNGSRRGLWLALGLAHMFVVGIYGLAAATFLPWTLRITHSVEIGCDSFVYAGLLVLLFTAPAARSEQSIISHAA